MTVSKFGFAALGLWLGFAPAVVGCSGSSSSMGAGAQEPTGAGRSGVTASDTASGGDVVKDDSAEGDTAGGGEAGAVQAAQGGVGSAGAEAGGQGASAGGTAAADSTSDTGPTFEGEGSEDYGSTTPPPAIGGDPAFLTDHFTGSGACAMCHDGIVDGAGQDVSIVAAWSSTMMANSSRDPFWQAKLRSELLRSPEAAPLLSDKCSRCHAPMANHGAKGRGEPVEVFEEGFLSAMNVDHSAAADGVSCTVCHQISDTGNLGSEAATSGNYTINDERTIFGPYEAPLQMPMINMVSYTPTYGAHVRDSALCASCHDVRTPVLDAAGAKIEGVRPFPEQMPYTEWLSSDYAGSRSCQDCHMGRTDGVIISNRPPFLTTVRDGFALHGFAGANRMVLEMLRDYGADLGVRAQSFDTILQRTDAMLGKSAELSIDDISQADGMLEFTVSVRNLGGHKLPTSFPSRRVILGVSVEDADGKVLFASGMADAQGRVTADDRPAGEYEPHHEVISEPGQAQIYEAIMGDSEGAVTFGLLRAQTYVKDNRLLPSGADKSALPEDVQVVGVARDDASFIGGMDSTRYRIQVDGAGISIRARLQYQTLSPRFAADMFRVADPTVERFARMYKDSPSKTVTLSELVRPL